MVRGVVGTAAFALVDALAAGALAGVLVLLFPVGLFGSRVAAAAVVSGVVAAFVLAIALAVALRGGKPFPATRAVLAVFDRLPDWM